MSGACTPASDGALPITDLLGWADCRAEAIGWGGYQALGQGSWFATILTGALTIAVALQGYRMLAGRAPDLLHGLSIFARIGVAIALAGSVGAYGTLIYRVATDAPFEVSSRIADAAGIASDDLPGRLDRLYAVIRLDPETRGRIGGGGEPRMPPASANGDGGQRGTAILFVMVSAGPWLALRLTMALMLAFGPFAALTLLFDATVALFLAWLRVIGGMAIALAGLAIAIPLQLEVLEPIAERAGVGTPDYTAMAAVLGVFAILSVAILVAAWRITGIVGTRARATIRVDAAGVPARTPGMQAAVPVAGPPHSWAGAAAAAGAVLPPAQRSHAASVANALANAARRDDPARATIEDARGAPRATGLAPRNALAAAAPMAAQAGVRRALPHLRPSDRTQPR